MFVGPSARYFYARKIRQIHQIKSFPYKISSIFNGLKVWILSKFTLSIA